MAIKKHLIIFAAVGLLCLLCGILIGRGCSHQPFESKTERDTLWLHDTVPDLNPTPKDSAHIKYVTRWLPMAVHDTVLPENYAQNSVEIMHDTVAVQVPITSKHYTGKNYDAYVSGFEPSLDSIFVYNETQIITERVTISKPPNKWELDVVGGVDYKTTQKEYAHYIYSELLYKPNRLQVGVRAGVSRMEKTEPFVGGVVKIRLF